MPTFFTEINVTENFLFLEVSVDVRLRDDKHDRLRVNNIYDLWRF